MIQYAIGTPTSPILNAYVASSARVSVIDGPLGSGKTTASCQRLLRHMVEQEPNARGVRQTRFLVCRNTYPDLLTTTVPSFMSFFFPDRPHPRDPATGELMPAMPNLGRYYGGGEEPPHAEFDFLLPDQTFVQSLVWFLSLDRPADVRRLLGLEITGVWLSEVKELDRSIIDMLDLRHGRFPSAAQGGQMPTWHGMFGDTNKPDTDHWLYTMAERERPVGWEFHHQPGGLVQTGVGADGRKRWAPNAGAENLENLPGRERYYVDGQAGKRDDWIAVYLANEYGYVQAGKPVHPDFVDSIHTAPSVLLAVERLPLVLGFDFGRTPACIVLQWWPGPGRWAALAEFIAENMSATAFAPELKAWLGREFRGFEMRGWGDPAGDAMSQAVEDTPLRILTSFGVPCRPAPTNDPLLRRSALDGPLRRGTIDGRRAFLLSPRCEVTRRGLMGGWEYERVNRIGVEVYKDQPAKNRYSHVCEALEYALAGEGEAEAMIVPALSRYGGVPPRAQEMAEM